MPISGPAVASIGAGALFIYAGIKGQSVLKAIENVVSGKAPSTGNVETATLTTGNNSSGSGSGASSSATTNNSVSANQALAKQLAIQMGHSDWTTGQEWSDWVSLWNQESGWSINAANPTSSARGIAQNINGYGPDYLQGNAGSQISWGINYIAERYGSPSVAWQHEREYNWY
jgi:resuscitation-promoting factor RpfB